MNHTTHHQQQHNTEANPNAPERRERLDPAAAALFASAAVLAGLLIAQLSSVVPSPAAFAQSGGVDRDPDVVTLTARGSSDSSVLLVLDQRDERLYCYELENGRRLRLVDGESLPELFASGSRGSGRR